MRFHYNHSRPKFDVVTAIELGDLECGYHAIDIGAKDKLPVKSKGELPTIPVDERAAEVRAIKVG